MPCIGELFLDARRTAARARPGCRRRSRCEKRLIWVKLWIGMMPGTYSASIPAAARRSRKRRMRSVSKQYWVTSRVAPASTLRRRLSRSASALGGLGMDLGVAAGADLEIGHRLEAGDQVGGVGVAVGAAARSASLPLGGSPRRATIRRMPRLPVVARQLVDLGARATRRRSCARRPARRSGPGCAQTSGSVPSSPAPPAPQVTEMKRGPDGDELLEIRPQPGRGLGPLGREHLDRQLDLRAAARSEPGDAVGAGRRSATASDHAAFLRALGVGLVDRRRPARRAVQITTVSSGPTRRRGGSAHEAELAGTSGRSPRR